MTTVNFEELHSNVDEIVDALMKTEALKLKDRIGDNVVELRNYLKNDGGVGRVTGKALLLNKISNLCVIDFDINKSYNDELKESIRKQLISQLSDEDVVVRTGSGGLHVYCNTEFFTVRSNRMIKCYSCSDFDIDLMTSIDETKRSLIVLPESRVRKNAREPITKYEFIRGGWNSTITRSISDVLNDLDIKITIEQKSEEINNIVRENVGVMINDELARALVDGLYDFEVHNDGGNMSIEKEVTLFTLFQAINSLPKEFVEEAYINVFDLCKLTDNAKNNFETAKQRYGWMSTSPFVLVKILKLHQTEYYNEYIKPLLKNNTVVFGINLNDDFTMTDIRRKAEQRLYKYPNEVIEDLSKVIRFVDNEQRMFVQKVWNVDSKTSSISFVTTQSMRDSLKMIKLWKDGQRYVNAYDILLTKLTELTVKGVCFKSNDKDVFSLFHGYKYNVLDKCNYEVIKSFINFIKEIICDNVDTIFKYVMGWIATMIQNPGVKNETAIILKGLQGIGKNRFTDIISELLAGYSCKNVTDMNELTGSFNSVVENKMLIVLNELKNNGEDRMVNFNALKSIITDDTIRINEKNQPRRTAENVANFIFCTNNAYPVKIEVGDRRYVVLNVNGKYKGQFDYFSALMKGCTNEFYANLLTFFMKYDLSTFNVRDIPMTDAKQDLIEASRSPVDQFICDHYDSLVKGMQCSLALGMIPKEMTKRNFELQIKQRCERKKVTIDGARPWCYVLKNECKELYQQTKFDEDEELINNYIENHDECI